MIQDQRVATASSVDLRIEDQIFASMDEGIDVAITVGDRRARVETDRFVLEGEINLERIEVHPRSRALHDGWIEINRAKLLGASGSVAKLEVDLGSGLTPSTLAIEIPCTDLSSAKLPYKGATGDRVDIKATPLLRAPDGPKLAQVDGIRGYVQERRGGQVRIRILDYNPVEGWIAASATTPTEPPEPATPRDEDDNIYGGLVEDESFWMNCPDPVPLYFRTKSNRVVKVGHVKPKAKAIMREHANSSDEIAVHLDSDFQLFTKSAEMSACK